MLFILILWVFRCLVNWFDKSWNDTKNKISRSNFFVFLCMCFLSSWEIFLLSGNFFASFRIHTIVLRSYLFWKYSSTSSSETPSNFQKIALRSCCLRNIDIHQKRFSPWIVLCLLVKANLFAWSIHELELFVSSVCICEDISFRIQCKTDVYCYYLFQSIGVIISYQPI